MVIHQFYPIGPVGMNGTVRIRRSIEVSDPNQYPKFLTNPLGDMGFGEYVITYKYPSKTFNWELEGTMKPWDFHEFVSDFPGHSLRRISKVRFSTVSVAAEELWVVDFFWRDDLGFVFGMAECEMADPEKVAPERTPVWLPIIEAVDRDDSHKLSSFALSDPQYLLKVSATYAEKITGAQSCPP